MSGALNGPLLLPEQADRLLEEVIYERVLSCIDLDALLAFESELGCAFDQCGVVGDDKLAQLAKEMIDRALRRICDDPRRYAYMPGALSCDEEPSGCELCDDEAALRASKPSKRKTG